VAYSFIAPNLIGFSIFTLIPMGFALALAFMQWDLADNSFIFVGLDNFLRLRTDHLFWPSLRNTIQFSVMVVPLTLVFSLSLALLLNNKIRGRSIFRSVMFFPHVTSMIAMAAVWNQIFHPSWGPVNQFLMFLGMEEGIRWTITPWIIPNIAFFTAWRNMGYFMIIYLAGLQGIPKELYEAASIDGANSWKRFLYITIPQLRFVTFFVTVMLTIMSFRVFEQVIMITNTDTPGSGATMMVVHIFRVAFINWDFGYASAVALVLLALAMSVTIVQFLIQRRHERDY
jgi:multiple sugar transport system permease protein